MGTRWSGEQVLGLAPDASSAKAGRGLAVTRPWSGLGCSERAVWGLCQGSGAKVYQTSVDLEGPAYKCSCPSRKIPCKHALGLLLLWSGEPTAVAEADPTDWVAEWLDARDARASSPARAPAVPADPATAAERAAAREKRAEERAAKITAGLTELDRWLRDLVRQGLAGAPSQPYAFWDGAAARMVDAQAPGVASTLRRLAGVVHGDERWPDRLLAHLGRLHLVTSAWPRRAELPPDVQADLRSEVGWAVASEEVLAGDAVRDRWSVLARSVVHEERLSVQRTWLWGSRGQPALVLDFAAGGASLPADLAVGTVIDADLVFYPGSVRLRALVAARHATPGPLGALPGSASIDDALGRCAAALAANPFVERLPMSLTAVVPTRRGEGWLARDTGGAALPLAVGGDTGWVLHAVAGGHPIGLVGEWDGERLAPLAAWDGDRLVRL